jgi:5,10-methylenetetrahydromethanopterin reductase
MEIGIILPPHPTAAQLAQLAEGLGFDSLRFHRQPEPRSRGVGQLMVAAGATSRITLGPGVTNSVTRDPAVTASAALGLQVESKGRAACGIGRGDSAVQRIGKDTDPVASFETYIARLQRISPARPSIATASRAGSSGCRPSAREGARRGHATGRKVIDLAARRADRVALAVGADLEHLGEAREQALESARRSRPRPGALRIGAYLNCFVSDDRAVAHDAVRGTVATFARFSAFKGSQLARLPAPLQKVAAYLREHYDMRVHTRSEAEHARALEDECHRLVRDHRAGAGGGRSTAEGRGPRNRVRPPGARRERAQPDAATAS